MSLRTDASRGSGRAPRRWPDLLLGALLPAAPAISGHAGFTGAWPIAWGIAAAAAALVLLLRFQVRKAPVADSLLLYSLREQPGIVFRLLLLAVACLHLAAAAAGTQPAGAAASAGVLLLAAGLLPGWWRIAACWATTAALEAGRLLAQTLAPPAGGAPPIPAEWTGVAASLGVLALLALLAWWFFQRMFQESGDLKAAMDDHRRLRREAEAYRALDDQDREPAAERLSPSGKDTRIVSAVVGLDRDLDRLLALGRVALGARGVFLFLREGDPDLLPLRRASVVEEGPKIGRAAAAAVGEGVVGHAAQTHRPALFTDLAPGSLRPALYEGGVPSPSLVVVPVREEGVFRGLLVAEAPAPGAFGREQERLLEGFAGGVGTLLEDARSDARRERHGHRLEALKDIFKELSSTIKLDELLERMLDLARELVPYDRCAFFLADQAKRRLLLKAQRGFAIPEGEEQEVSWDHGLPGFIAQQGRPMVFSDLKERERGVEIVPGHPGQQHIRSLLGIPVRDREGLVGVWVLTAEEPGRFSADDLELLSVVAAQAGVVVANASLHQEVERMAVTDGLTGLFNHRHFQERLGHEVERAARGGGAVSLLLMDIDHFKKVNDTYGHPFGDKVLKALARELRRLARRVDFVARYGGEEFALVLVGTDRRGCRTTVGRILKAVRGIKVPHEGGVFTFTASIGTATCPDDAASREDLVRLADQALYAAKAGGRDQARAAEGAAA